MARKNSNIGWKIFGGIVIAILVVVAAIALAVWIGSAVNHISFAEQFKNWFSFFYPNATEEPSAVETAVRSLFLK